MELQERINSYLKVNPIKDLERYSWVSRKTLTRIAKHKEGNKYYKKTLDILYKFFKIDKDKFYVENNKKWHWDSSSLLWRMVRNKRIYEHKDLATLSKEMNVDVRVLGRVERWECCPLSDSWTINSIIDKLNFSELERKVTNEFIESIKKMESLVKKWENNLK